MAALAYEIDVNLRLGSGELEKAGQTLVRAAKRLGEQTADGWISAGQQAAALETAVGKLEGGLGRLGQAAKNAMQPVLMAVVPVMDAVVNAAVRAMAAVGGLAQRLFGGLFTFEKAAEGADAYAGGLKSTGSAARRLKKDLAGFDELDVLMMGSTGGGVAVGSSAETEEWVLVSTLLEGIQARLREIKEYIAKYFGPALQAWGEAFAKVRTAAEECATKVMVALGGLWQQGLAPFLSYLLTDFVPAVVNAFSGTIAPILADIIAALLFEFGETFAFVCELATRAMHELLIPAFELVKTVFVDVMQGIQDAWNEYGGRILEAFHGICEGLRELALEIYESIVLPLVERLMEVLTRLWEESLQPLWQKLALMLGALVETLLNLWNEVLVPFLGWLVEHLGPLVTVLAGGLLETWEQFFAGMAALFGGFLDLLRGVLEFLSGVFTKDWERAWKGLGLAVEGVWNGLSGFIKGVVNKIIAMINGMLAGIAAGINAVASAVNSISITIPDWVPGIGGSTLGFSLPMVSAPQMPYLAKGAVIPPNRQFLAVLGDQKSGRNLEAPEGLIRQLLREELAGMQGQDVTIQFNGSLSQLARVLQPEIVKESTRRGTALVTGGIGC